MRSRNGTQNWNRRGLRMYGSLNIDILRLILFSLQFFPSFCVTPIRADHQSVMCQRRVTTLHARTQMQTRFYASISLAIALDLFWLFSFGRIAAANLFAGCVCMYLFIYIMNAWRIIWIYASFTSSVDVEREVCSSSEEEKLREKCAEHAICCSARRNGIQRNGRRRTGNSIASQPLSQ